MSPSSITKKTFSSCTFKTLATKVKTKLETKLEKVKCGMHKTKAANNTSRVIAAPKAAAPKAVVPKAVVPKAADDETQVITDNVTAEREADNVLAEFKTVVANMPMPANYNTKFVNEPIRSDKDAHEAVADVASEHTSEDGHNRCDTKNKQQKPAKEQARREARRARWATRRTAFKCKAKKVGEAILLSTAVAGGVIFAPVILAVSVLFAVVKFLIWLVVKILDLLCCGPVLVCFVCKEAM